MHIPFLEALTCTLHCCTDLWRIVELTRSEEEVTGCVGRIAGRVDSRSGVGEGESAMGESFWYLGRGSSKCLTGSMQRVADIIGGGRVGYAGGGGGGTHLWTGRPPCTLGCHVLHPPRTRGHRRLVALVQECRRTEEVRTNPLDLARRNGHAGVQGEGFRGGRFVKVEEGERVAWGGRFDQESILRRVQAGGMLQARE